MRLGRPVTKHSACNGVDYQVLTIRGAQRRIRTDPARCRRNGRNPSVQSRVHRSEQAEYRFFDEVYSRRQTPKTVKADETANRLNGTPIRRMNRLFQPLRHARMPVYPQ
jgi:hypothetical protein